MNAIEIKNLSKEYKDFKLDNINLKLPQGTILGLVGENGAGKSTTIKLIMNAIEADDGDVTVLGTPNTSEDFINVKQDIGIVLDSAYFPEVLNAKNINNIMKNIYKNWDEAQFENYINKLKLPKNKKFNDYSRGMKMKLSIAVALSHNPKLLILDEATGGLDPLVRDEILEMFNEFTRDENHSILLSSHIVSDLEKICDYIAFIHKGKLIMCEEKDVILEKYCLMKLSENGFHQLAKKAIIGQKRRPYGYDVLALKNELKGNFSYEKTNLEEIIIFMAKEDI